MLVLLGRATESLPVISLLMESSKSNCKRTLDELINAYQNNRNMSKKN